jgi:hypothetical protein
MELEAFLETGTMSQDRHHWFQRLTLNIYSVIKTRR